MTPSENRKVRPIPPELRELVPSPVDNNVTVKKGNPDVETDTMPLIVTKTKRTAWQTKKLAARLKASSLSQTLQNDSAFILRYIAYKQDSPLHEQVRSPRRLIADGYGDCDCYAVFLGTLLINQGIDFRFRLAQYGNNGGDWTHIYVVVPKDQSFKGSLTDRSSYIVLDPVTNQHNYEVAYSKKRDFNMALQFLDGFSSSRTRSIGMGACTTEQTVTPDKLRKFVDTDLVVQTGMVPTQQMLEDNYWPYEQQVDTQANAGYFVVYSPTGPIQVAPVLTSDQAEQLKQQMAQQPVSSQPSSPTISQTAVIGPVPSAAAVQVQSSQPGQTQTTTPTNWLNVLFTVIGVVSAIPNAGNPSLGALPKQKHRAPVHKAQSKRKYQAIKM